MLSGPGSVRLTESERVDADVVAAFVREQPTYDSSVVVRSSVAGQGVVLPAGLSIAADTVVGVYGGGLDVGVADTHSWVHGDAVVHGTPGKSASYLSMVNDASGTGLEAHVRPVWATVDGQLPSHLNKYAADGCVMLYVAVRDFVTAGEELLLTSYGRRFWNAHNNFRAQCAFERHAFSNKWGVFRTSNPNVLSVYKFNTQPDGTVRFPADGTVVSTQYPDYLTALGNGPVVLPSAARKGKPMFHERWAFAQAVACIADRILPEADVLHFDRHLRAVKNEYGDNTGVVVTDEEWTRALDAVAVADSIVDSLLDSVTSSPAQPATLAVQLDFNGQTVPCGQVRKSVATLAGLSGPTLVQHLHSHTGHAELDNPAWASGVVTGRVRGGVLTVSVRAAAEAGTQCGKRPAEREDEETRKRRSLLDARETAVGQRAAALAAAEKELEAAREQLEADRRKQMAELRAYRRKLHTREKWVDERQHTLDAQLVGPVSQLQAEAMRARLRSGIRRGDIASMQMMAYRLYHDLRSRWMTPSQAFTEASALLHTLAQHTPTEPIPRDLYSSAITHACMALLVTRLWNMPLPMPRGVHILPSELKLVLTVIAGASAEVSQAALLDRVLRLLVNSGQQALVHQVASVMNRPRLLERMKAL